MATTSQIYIVSLKHLRQVEAELKISKQSYPASPPSSVADSDSVVRNDFYKRLDHLTSTIISLQYNANEFLTFALSHATQGQIVHSGAQGISLQCQIHNKTYIFTREHFDQMSNREVTELLHYLGVDGSQLFQNS